MKYFKRKQACSIGLFFFMFIGMTACNKSGGEVCRNSESSGFKTLVVGSESREYILHIPTSYDPNTSSSLLLNFHGFGGCASSFVDESGNLNNVANQNNVIVVYPQGVTRSKGSAEWDPGDSGVNSIQDNDIYFVEQLIAAISAEYNIDEARVYASGYSNGGMMAYGLACSKSDQIAAVGIMSGIMLAGNCNTNEFTSIIHFHGVDDNVLPYDGNQDFQSVNDVLGFWLAHNNISASSKLTTSLNGGDVILDSYTGGSGNTSFALYTVNREYGKDGGHVWFSEEINGVSPNELLWNFLSQYSLDD